MRVLFLKAFDWRVPERKGRSVISYPAGLEITVRRVCGEEAMRQQKAEELPPPVRAI